MTLDGHLKSGLSGSFSLAFLVLYNIPEIDIGILLALTLGFLIGNVFPDFSELGVVPHRTFTHYWPFYAFPLFYFFAAPDVVFSSAYVALFAGICAGSLVHIICDWPYYGGVPLFFPRRKVALFRFEFDGAFNRFFEHCVMLFFIALAFFFVNGKLFLLDEIDRASFFN